VDPSSRTGRLVQRIAGSPAFAKVGPRLAPRIDRAVYRLTGGRIMVSNGMLPVLMLTTTGARSGLPRTAPLATIPLDGDFYVVGSNFGQEKHPAWSANLIAHPEATVGFEGEEFPVRADLLGAGAKAEVWPRLVEIWPLFDQYATRSGRDLRVFRLSRVDRPPGHP
jgi:deazaflavin-dependent oxidoreductase (nitroreductase family)